MWWFVLLALQLECLCSFQSRSHVGVDANVGKKAMFRTSSLQKAKQNIPSLADENLSWLDQELADCPSTSAAPSGKCGAPSVRLEAPESDAETEKTSKKKSKPKRKAKAKKVSVWEEHFPTKNDRKTKWCALDKNRLQFT